METETNVRSTPHARPDRVPASLADLRAGTIPPFPVPPLRRCQRCKAVCPLHRRRYCSDNCAHQTHLANTRTWKRRFRDQNGHWPSPPADYWSLERRREKGREYTARWRAKNRQRDKHRHREAA